MASPGSHAREGIQGHYYLPLPVYDFCPLQDRRCAHMAHRSVKDPTRAPLTSASSETRPMSWPHVEGPVQSYHQLLMILRIRWPRPAPLHRRPLTLPRSSLSWVVAQPRAPLAQHLYHYRPLLLGSKNWRHKWPPFCIISSRGCRSLLLSLKRVWRGRCSGRLLRFTSASMHLS